MFEAVISHPLSTRRIDPRILPAAVSLHAAAALVAITVNVWQIQEVPAPSFIEPIIYVKMAPGVTVDRLRAAMTDRYRDEYFVRVLPNGSAPATRHVRGSNFCLMSVHADRVANRAIVMAVIDNLVKGASGQAVQNMNVMAGFPEETALEQLPLFP